MVQIKQAVILAGGLGTRLKPITDKIPKPMILMNGKPFLEYLLEMLKDNGIQEVVLLLGYFSEKVQEYFGDGSKFGLRIKYSIGDVSFETGKRIKLAEELIEDNFLLMYCDNYWPLNLNKLIEYHNNHNVQATITVYTNKDNFSKNNMKVDEQGYVVLYDKSRQEKNLLGVEIGFYILCKNIFTMMTETNFSFEKEIIPKLIEQKQLAGYLTDHRYYSVGSLERLPVTEDFLKQKKVIFLDRDGVINKKVPKADYVKNWGEFEFLSGVIEAMKKLTDEGFEIYIISNQPGIARGMMTDEDLRNITENMMKLLKNKGVLIKKIYYCTHGWDDGCECRKPKPGMFYQAGRENNLNLSKAIFIGDDERDVMAGEAAGIRTILLTSEKRLLDVVNEIIN